jgi:hypothetical protein
MDLLGYGKHPMGDSESEEGESGDEDEDDSMDESEEDESSDDDVMAHRHKEPSVIIEDITDQEVGEVTRVCVAAGIRLTSINLLETLC